MTDEAVEKAADAIRRTFLTLTQQPLAVTWEAMPEMQREIFRQCARAAMKECNWASIDLAPQDGRYLIGYKKVGKWDAMGLIRWVAMTGFTGWMPKSMLEPPGELGLAHPTHFMFIPNPPK